MRERDPGGRETGGRETGDQFRYGDVMPSEPVRGASAVDVLPGDAADALFFHQDQLAGAAIPLRWNTRSEGCCGPEARFGPNVMCHGCGAWVMFYNETCYSPRFFAARPSEVETREVDPAAAGQVDTAERSKKHWANVALSLPGVVSWKRLVEELVEDAQPLLEARGGRFEVCPPRDEDVARIDRAKALEAARHLLEHALEVAGGPFELRAGVGGAEARIELRCRAPLAPNAVEGIPSIAHRCAREQSGQITTWRFPDGDLVFTLTLAAPPIPLKPVRAG